MDENTLLFAGIMIALLWMASQFNYESSSNQNEVPLNMRTCGVISLKMPSVPSKPNTTNSFTDKSYNKVVFVNPVKKDKLEVEHHNKFNGHVRTHSAMACAHAVGRFNECMIKTLPKINKIHKCK